MRGEHRNIDSIHLDDIQIFTTPEGDTVYGGGGIMPDIFIPADTTGMSMYFARVRNTGIIYRFALNYTEANRERLQEFGSVNEMSDFMDRQNLLPRFIEFAEENGIPPVNKDLEASGELIEIQIKAYIARNILDNDGFYPIWQGLDTTLQRAIEYIGD